MLRKALSLKRFPYKSGCACSEKWGRPSTFALLFTRLGGHAPKSWTAAGLARAFFIRFYRFLGGYTPKKHWIFSRETGWSCSEFCSNHLITVKRQNAILAESAKHFPFEIRTHSLSRVLHHRNTIFVSYCHSRMRTFFTLGLRPLNTDRPPPRYLSMKMHLIVTLSLNTKSRPNPV